VFTIFVIIHSSFLCLYVSSINFTRLLLLLVKLFSRLSRKLSVYDTIRIKNVMLIFDHRISPESLSVEF
jgi:hypothetical protein